MYSLKKSSRAGVLVLMLVSTAINAEPVQSSIATRPIGTLSIEGKAFRDLNRNGALDTYEDWQLTPAQRAADLVKHMSLEEKAGQMVIANAYGNAPFGQPATGYDLGLVRGTGIGAHVTSFNSMLVLGAGELAQANNAIQAIMEEGRLGILAVTVTDPRHHFQETTGAIVGAGDFSQWPEPLGFAAIGDAALMTSFGAVVRRDLRGGGFQPLLGPQADISTEPRWPRNNGTLGEDPGRVGALVAAYIDGVRGNALASDQSGDVSVHAL